MWKKSQTLKIILNCLQDENSLNYFKQNKKMKIKILKWQKKRIFINFKILKHFSFNYEIYFFTLKNKTKSVSG